LDNQEAKHTAGRSEVRLSRQDCESFELAMENHYSTRTPSVKWSVIFFAGVLILWQVLLPILHLPSYLLPTPLAILEEFHKRGGFIFANSLPTFYETMLGFAIGALVGIASGLGIVYSRFLWLTIYPSLVVIGSIPRIAIAPLLLIWFGIDSIWSKVMIAFLVAFFPMVVNSVVGFSQIDNDMLDLAKTMGMKPFTEFRKIRLPNSIPYLFAGFKASIALAVIGAVVAEFVSGQQGLGYLIIIGNNELNSALIFASITVLSTMSLGLFGIIVGLEKWLMPWRRGLYPTEL
jgi:NitT/TauT family transport system permease protein